MGYLAAAHKDSIAWLSAGNDVKSPIDFMTHCCFQIYFLRVPPLIGFTVGSYSESVSGCDCKLHYAEDTEMSF